LAIGPDRRSVAPRYLSRSPSERDGRLAEGYPQEALLLMINGRTNGRRDRLRQPLSQSAARRLTDGRKQ